MLVVTFIPIIGVAAYALIAMADSIAVEDDLKMAKTIIHEAHALGDLIHYLQVYVEFTLKGTLVMLPSKHLTAC